MRNNIFLPAFLLCLPLAGATPYAYSRAIVIDHTKVANSDQNGFPVLFSGTYSYLATTANGGKVQNGQGYDIVFAADAAGTNALPFEMEKYSATDGTVVFWVRVPTVSHTSDTVFYMLYGNASINSFQGDASGVWDASFKGVWHLPTTTTPVLSGWGPDYSIFWPLPSSPRLSARDSTSNGNHGTVHSADMIAGEIGGGASFNGDPATNIAVPAGSSIDIVGAETWEAWVYPYQWSREGILSKDGDGLGNFGWVLDLDRSNYVGLSLKYTIGDVAVRGSTSLFQNAWNHVVVTWDGVSGDSPGAKGRIKLYVNGVQETSFITDYYAGIGVHTAGDDLILGGPALVPLAGRLDEVRISNTVRSADWIVTEYNNQSAPAAFYSVGPEMPGTSIPITVTVLPPSVALFAGNSVPFLAVVANSADTAVLWSIPLGAPGSVDANGLYLAPASVATQQTVTVTATSHADQSKSGTATVTLIAPVYSHRRAITVDHTKIPNSDATNFPVFFSGTYDFLANVNNGGGVQNASGYDIIFTRDAAGVEQLDHEIEAYNAATGAIAAWVRVPSVSHDCDTQIYLWYGSSTVNASQEHPTGVWDPSFQAVWHLANGSLLSTADSTSHGWNGIDNGVTAVPGKLDGAGNFQGSQYIEIGNMGATPTKGSISMWLLAPALASFPNTFTTGAFSVACGNAAFRFELNGAGLFGGVIGSDGATCGGGFTGLIFTPFFGTGTWHQLAVTWDIASNIESTYWDGQLAQTMANGFWPSSFSDVKIGGGWDPSRFWVGTLDEVRMSTAVRSADWIAAEFANQNSPSTFYGVGGDNAVVMTACKM